MISRLFNASRGIASAAVVLGLSGLLSRLLGVYRDRLLASTFGAGATLDAYYAAFRIPDFVFNIIVLGALSAGFIPIFSEYVQHSRERAWRLAQATLIVIGGSLVLLCGILFAFADSIVPILTPGFSDEVLDQTIVMTRIMLLSPFFLGLSGVFGGVLQSFKRFLAYSLAPILYNVGIIVGIAVFSKEFGSAGLAWGVVLGSVLHLALQSLVAFRLGWKWTFFNPFAEEGLRGILSLMGPRTLSLALNESTVFIVTVMASGLAAGSLAMFNFAHNLAHVPIGLFGISFAVAAFPVLSTYISQGRKKKFKKTMHKTLSSLLFFVLPTVVLFVLMNEQIVRLVLGAGKFDWVSTKTTSMALLFMSLHMFAQSIIPLYTRSYYAQKNTWYPFYAALFGVLINVFFAYTLSRRYGVPGLALSLSIASTMQLIALVFGPQVKATYLSIHSVKRTIRQTFYAAAAMFLVVYGVMWLVGPALDLFTVRGVLIHFLVPSALGVFAYLAVLKALGSTEYATYEQLARHKITLVIRPSLPNVGTGEEDDIMKH